MIRATKKDCMKIGSEIKINGIKYYVVDCKISQDKKSINYTIDNYDFYNKFGQPRIRHIVKTISQTSTICSKQAA